MRKLLVVGQTPPPFGGQALMTERLVNAKFDNIEIIHVRLAFSENFSEVGKVSIKKFLHVFSVAFEILKHRIANRRLILYYMPAGPNLVPVIRDLLLLAMVRPFFSRTIYHFRAAGISDFINKKSSFFKWMCRKIYGKPTVAIQLSALNPQDALFFSAKKIYHIPNGIEDEARSYINSDKEATSIASEGITKILFVGVLREDKGFTWLLNSLRLLLEKGISNFQLFAVGEFSSTEYKAEIMTLLDKYNIKDKVVFAGVKTGKEKWNFFSKADLLCFPTFFDCESFGNVLLEAMMFQLPVISSEWRGIPDIVTKETGLLVPIRDEEKLAQNISVLMKDKRLRRQMGLNARRRYLEKYTLEQYLTQMENIITSIN